MVDALQRGLGSPAAAQGGLYGAAVEVAEEFR